MKNRAAEVKGILFDWDGTIVDTSRPMFLSYRYAYEKHLGLVFPSSEAEFRQIVAMRLAESSARFGGDYAAEVAESYNWYYLNEGYKAGSVFPGVARALEELKRRGYSLGVVSNKSRDRIQSDILYHRLDGLTGVLVTSEDTAERKPHPAPLLKGAEKLGIPPHDLAYVGDYAGDVVAAREAGMVSVAILWGSIYLVDTLLAEHPDYTAATPEELLALFAGPMHMG